MLDAYITHLNEGRQKSSRQISAKILKIYAATFARTLVNLFSIYSHAGILLTYWKIGNIAPTPKKGNSKSFANYCPIEICPSIVKTMETMFNYLQSI